MTSQFLGTSFIFLSSVSEPFEQLAGEMEICLTCEILYSDKHMNFRFGEFGIYESDVVPRNEEFSELQTGYQHVGI